MTTLPLLTHIHRVYNEIGFGERIALSKLAVQHIESDGRSMRIAVDVSIWLYQIQAGKGGENSELRILYYRLLRLLKLSIRPLFVFDGPHKPRLKRNKRVGTIAASPLVSAAKELFGLFSFPYLTAPGEAEAECAALQQEGIVDAVMSEDVDTLMFGCTHLLKNWSSEGVRGNKSPTHVNAYHAPVIKAESGLDRQGLVLVALMSGGDYIPAGIPKCGIKTACEAARAGFGHDLFELKQNDVLSNSEWRERLEYELQSNVSGYFRVQRKSLTIPKTFPDREVLYYYMHPVVSNADQINKYKTSIQWNGVIDTPRLWAFAAKTFEWDSLDGSKHFIRSFAPALLGHTLAQGLGGQDDSAEDLEMRLKTEERLVKAICGKRNHITTDGILELRLAYIPTEVVNIDLGTELESGEDHTVIYQDLEGDNYASDADGSRRKSPGPPQRRDTSSYDPSQSEKEYFPETFAKLGVPVSVEIWESEQKRKVTETARAKAKPRQPLKMGTLDAFIKTSKPINETMREQDVTNKAQTSITPSRPKAKKSRKILAASLSKKDIHTNPWTLSQHSFGLSGVRSESTGGFSQIEGQDSTIVLLSSSPDAENYQHSKSASSPKNWKGPKRGNKNHAYSAPMVLSSDVAKHHAYDQLNFNAVSSSANLSPVSSSSELPSPSTLLSPLSRAKREKSMKSTTVQRVATKTTENEGKKVVLRQNSGGSCKHVEECDHAHGYTSHRCFSKVEVLDLTRI